MFQKIPKLTYQINLPDQLNQLEINKFYYSPIFSTDNKMFWKLMFGIEEEDFYGIYLRPVVNTDEVFWGERSKLSYKLFIKQIRNNQTIELHTSEFNSVPPDKEIVYGNILFNM